MYWNAWGYQIKIKSKDLHNCAYKVETNITLLQINYTESIPKKLSLTSASVDSLILN